MSPPDDSNRAEIYVEVSSFLLVIDIEPIIDFFFLCCMFVAFMRSSHLHICFLLYMPITQLPTTLSYLCTDSTKQKYNKHHHHDDLKTHTHINRENVNLLMDSSDGVNVVMSDYHNSLQ